VWHHDYRSWTALICGIIEAAGLASPCSAAVLKRSGDRTGADMRRLVALMAPEKDHTLQELADLCEEHELFERTLALRDKNISSFRSTFGKFLRNYDGRLFVCATHQNELRFLIEGISQNRTYRLSSKK
jgi:hypothetical protein